MAAIYLFPAKKTARLGAPVVAYVNESSPVRGQASLKAQIKAVQKRARRDGIPIKLLVIESGGHKDRKGCGLRLAAVIRAAMLDPAPRVLYVADPRFLADGPKATLAAMQAIFDAGFELRAPCGTIAPKGRTVARIEKAVAAHSKEATTGVAQMQALARKTAPMPTRTDSWHIFRRIYAVLPS